MFVKIDTKGANHILINIPKEGCDRSLPMIAKMFESNAVFIDSQYRECKLLKPDMSIILGDSVTFSSYGTEDIVVSVGDASEVIDETFQIASPDVFVSIARAIKSKDEKISALNTEISYLKQQIKSLNDNLEPVEAV